MPTLPVNRLFPLIVSDFADAEFPAETRRRHTGSIDMDQQ
jgi:hypothetical protein